MKWRQFDNHFESSAGHTLTYGYNKSSGEYGWKLQHPNLPEDIYNYTLGRMAADAAQWWVAAMMTGYKTQSEQKFWLVWNPQGQPSIVKHLSIHEAQKEAERLAILKPAQKFYVMQVVGVARATGISYTAIQ
jgi:hypothetical protein